MNPRPAGKRGPSQQPKASQQSQPQPQQHRTPAGLPARELAVRLVTGVLMDRKPFDQQWAEVAARPSFMALEPRDRGLVRSIAATVLRRQGQLEYVLNAFLDKPLPAEKGRLWPNLLVGAAQLVFLGLPAHAVVDIAVELAHRDRGARRFAKLANAVLRRVSERGKLILAEQDGTRLDTPDWIWQRWSAAYGEETARRIAAANLEEAPLDITLKSGAPNEAREWAEKLGGALLPTGTVRLTAHGRIEELAGFADGAWWVQDAAAALVARMAGDVEGREVADLCAAPGGKTAQLAAAGAKVTAVDVSAGRLARLNENLARLRIAAEVVQANAISWAPERQFDVVLLDAPCSATGTIRRHPDILRLKVAEDVGRMVELQKALLTRGAGLVRPGGLLVYATCSLEPEEGEHQVAAFLSDHGDFQREAITAGEIGAEGEWITPAGDLRTLPFHLAGETPEASGMDGFYAARLRRTA